MNYKLLGAFEALFKGVPYHHRKSTQGDRVASFLVDDLYALGRSPKLNSAVDAHDFFLSIKNKTFGRKHRRGDGTFGTPVPGETPLVLPEYKVGLGLVANIHIGAEVKTLAKAMIKQLDRVGTDLENQAAEFRKHGNDPICVGIVAINQAPKYTSYEGDRPWPTDGRKYAHPVQEAADAEDRLVARVQDKFDELIVLRFVAVNIAPFDFHWKDPTETVREYGSALVRLSNLCQKRL